MIDPLLFTSPRLFTFEHDRHLTNASPNRIEIEIHTNAGNLAESTGLSMLLYQDGKSIWRDGADGKGVVDIAVIEVDRAALPKTAVIQAFTPDHLVGSDEHVEIGSSLLVVGFPLGFHDTLHHLPVVRQAVVASSYGLRFQGEGYFLTDARTHRGTSGAPVVMRVGDGDLGVLPWKLLGVHSARLDIGTRDLKLDEALGLNCAWYADILMPLTEPKDSPV